MKKPPFAEVVKICEELLERGQYSELAAELARIRLDHQETEKWLLVRRLLDRVPQSQRAEHAAPLYAKALRLLQEYEPLLAWSRCVESSQDLRLAAAVKTDAAAGLNALKQYAQARELLHQAIPHLSGETLGIAWARLAFAAFNLKEPGWRAAYAHARPLLAGEELGRALLNEGYCLSREGLREQANAVWLEALPCFAGNAYFLAWLRYNLGVNTLFDLEPDAERHFLSALKHAQKPSAKSLRAATLIGLGTSRRVLGEWHRAEMAYREALRLSENDRYDREQALRNIVRTLRLSGRAAEALEVLEHALHEPQIDHQMLHVARALTYLALGRPTQARAALAHAGEVRAEADLWLLRIAQAELARQERRPEEAIRLLNGLPTQTLHSREEVSQFPLLFGLLRRAGRAVPEPLEYAGQTAVQVKALGALQVSVNGRSVPLAPTGRAGELLVLLLEHNAEASNEKLVEMLWPGNSATQKRQALWQLVDELRRALGWAGSVQSLRKAYRLDPAASWHYDVEAARAARRVKGSFMEGVYSDWALEVDQGLEGFRA